MRTARLVSTIALALAVVLTTTPGSDLPAAASDLRIHTLTPRPSQVVPAGDRTIEAWVLASAPIAHAELTLDGIAQDAEIGARDDHLGTPVRALAELDAGAHDLMLRVEDADGATVTRSWAVVVAGAAIERIAGSDRFATAVAAARAIYPSDASASAAVLARGDEFADALAGAPLASAVDGPLLLAERDELPEATASELVRVLPVGATVHLLGGTSALSDEVARAVEDLGLRPARHGAADRYATAAAIATRRDRSSHAFIVSGLTFPDALAASVPAARRGSPILLTRLDELPTATREALVDLGVTAATIVGGTAVVSIEVQRSLESLGIQVVRIAGADRFATAAAVAERFPGGSGQLALARGHGYVDALAGAPLLAARDASLLLTDTTTLSSPTTARLRRERPGTVLVLGGSVAIPPHLADEALAATTDGPDAPLIEIVTPGPGAGVTYLSDVHVRTDRDLADSPPVVYVTVDGVETATGTRLDEHRTVVLEPDTAGLTTDVAHDVSIHTTLTDRASGDRTHRSWSFSYTPPDPHYGDAGPVALFLPSDDVELVGFHQSNHDGAQQIAVRDTSTTTMTLETRYRGTGSRTAADIVANPDLPVYAPATGTVIRAGTYRLYCDHYDHYLVIEPDAAPGWEVKMLHFEGLAVRAGDRVLGGGTPVGSRPRTLPFESQVDEVSHDRNWPHVHVEVVDPSIPDRPGSGC